MTLQQFGGVVRRRWLVVFSVLAIGFALMYAFRNALPSTYAGTAHVLLVSDTGARDPSVSLVNLPSIATSTVVLERVKKSLDLPMSLNALKGGVSAGILGHSTIMSIGFRDLSADRAVTVSNAVADQLARYYDEISTKRYDQNVSRLSASLASQAAKLRDLDAKMGQVVAGNPYGVTDKSIDQITSQLATLTTARGEAAAQLAADTAMSTTTLPNANLSETARHEILAGDERYRALRSAAARDGAELTGQRAGYTPNFPGLPGAIVKVDAENDAVRQAASAALSDSHAFSSSAASARALHARQQATIDGDKARLAQLDALIAAQRENLQAVPSTSSAYSDLQAERSAAQTEYNALATRRANALANRAEASSLGSVVVLDRAIKADTRLASGRNRAAALAFVLVVALALGGAYLVEALDPRIRRREDVEELYGIPVIGRVGAARA